MKLSQSLASTFPKPQTTYDQQSECRLGGVSTRHPRRMAFQLPRSNICKWISFSFLPRHRRRRHCESVGKKTSDKLMMQFSHRQIDRSIDPPTKFAQILYVAVEGIRSRETSLSGSTTALTRTQIRPRTMRNKSHGKKFTWFYEEKPVNYYIMLVEINTVLRTKSYQGDPVRLVLTKKKESTHMTATIHVYGTPFL